MGCTDWLLDCSCFTADVLRLELTHCPSPPPASVQVMDLLASCPYGSAAAVLVNAVKASLARAADASEDMVRHAS
jgi:hypothetical protein